VIIGVSDVRLFKITVKGYFKLSNRMHYVLVFMCHINFERLMLYIFFLTVHWEFWIFFCVFDP
jgi:hypothetical protein